MRWIVMILAVLALLGCYTTVPEEDREPPTITLLITGPGMRPQSMANPPHELWPDEGGDPLPLVTTRRYRFTLMVSDPGGVARARLSLPREFRFSDLGLDVRETEDSLLRHLTLLGRREDPRDALVISGTFNTPELPETDAIAFAFLTEGDDFGGQVRRINQRFMNVNAMVYPPLR